MSIDQDARSIRYMSKMIINLGDQDPETSQALRDLIWQAAERIADWENENAKPQGSRKTISPPTLASDTHGLPRSGH
jgi:hypothetical protein